MIDYPLAQVKPPCRRPGAGLQTTDPLNSMVDPSVRLLAAVGGARAATAKSMPLVSVIIPAFNCGRFLAEAIDSVLAQTEPGIEVVVVDDGSTDDTLAIAERKAAQDARVRVFTQRNSGKPAIARNAGIRQARGEFIAFLDGDDRYAPDRVARVASVFNAHPQIDIVFHDVQIVEEAGRLRAPSSLAEHDYLQRAADHLEDQGGNVHLCATSFYAFISAEISGMHTNAVTVRSALLQRQSEWFPEDLVLMEDHDLWFRLVRDGKCAFLNESLSDYRKYGSSISSRGEQFRLDQFEAHRRNLQRARPFLSAAQYAIYRRKVADMQASIGYRRLLAGEAGEARRAYWQSLKILPQGRILLALAKTLVPARARRRLQADRAGPGADE
jgi:glycosyltransferase involved in cell wall biosynthesis